MYLAEAQEHLERERQYLQVEKVQRLAFVPFDTDSNNETEQEGKLKGQYRILVGDKQEMAADSGWVERNFRPEALAIVQRVGCQIKEKILLQVSFSPWSPPHFQIENADECQPKR